MKNLNPNKHLIIRRLKKNIILCCLIVFSTNLFSQDYPQQEQLPNINYQAYQSPSGSFPNYLESFIENMSGSTITRVSDKDVFGTTNQRLRHNYSKDQTWNSDETLIKLAGYPAAILDAETYEFLYWANIPSYGRWANTEPNFMYGTPSNRFVKYDVLTNSSSTLRTFTEYSSIDFGYGEGNQSNDDRYVGLIGRASNGNRILIVYDILNDAITGTKDIGTSGDLDWFSVSQLGGFAVAQWRTDGNGEKQGVKSYNIDMTNEIHIYDTSAHGDIGIDAYGNEVVVEYGGQTEWDNNHSLFMARLDGGGITYLFPYVDNRGIWGGHISCRNTDRPGWAYVSEQCCTTNPVAPREIFAIKLDGSGIIERYSKHHNNVAPGNGHSTMAVPNRNGTKILFASNWNDNSIMSDENPPVWVLEYPQTSSQGITVNAGNDLEICEGETTTLSASGNGATNYSWNTGETTQSITVSPNNSTTYTVTLSNDSGDQVSDSVLVTVNPLPTANAGNDITINLGNITILTASGGTSYEWSTGELTQSITVNPNITTTYSVTVTQNNCSSDDSVIVTVDNSTVANAGEDVAICDGESITLTASGGTSYVWNTGETTQSIIVTPDNTTTYTVTVSDGQTSDTDNVIVTVNPIPNANAGSDVTIFQGESTTLTASGGDSYFWGTGETTQSIIVSPNSGMTTYSVLVTLNSCTSSDSVVVTVNNSEVVANAGEDVIICQGNNAILFAFGGTSYLWNTGETTQSIVVSPNITTTYSVTVSDGQTSDTDNVTVNVNPLPNANAGDDVSIYLGDSTTLIASEGDSYEWSTGETTQNITVSPNSTTTYSVTVTSNTCSSTDSVTVTVSNVPVTANAGEDATICQGDNITLTASGGVSYIWNTGETTQSIVVSPNNNTTYSVTVSDGQTSDTDSVTINVNPLPNTNAGEDITIESGEIIMLSASGGNSYLWSTGETSHNIYVNPNENTTYSVTAFINNCSSSDDVMVSVVESISAYAGEDVFDSCIGESVTLTALGGNNYLWNTGETTQSIVVYPELEEEIYTVTVSNGISFETDEVSVFSIDCSETEREIDFNNINVYPNPTRNIANIKITGFNDVSSFQLYDIHGRLLKNQSINRMVNQPTIITLDLSSYPNGIYLLTIIENDTIHTKRIIHN